MMFFGDLLVISSQIDPLLLPFLNAVDVREEGIVLARLSTDEIEPTIRPIIDWKLHFHRRAELDQRGEIEEIYHDVQLRLLKRLRALKQNPTNKPITNLHSYVATVARNSCDEYLRRKYPLRRGLKDKIRHHLLNHSEFALWEIAEHSWLAGLCEWEDQNRTFSKLTSSSEGELRDRVRKELQGLDAHRLDLSDLMTAIFRLVTTPLELDQLTALVAWLWSIEDRPHESFEAGGHRLPAQTVDTGADPETIIEQRQLLQRLWREICLLPRRHRAALLLNLKNPGGINVIMLLPLTGVATFEQVAQALEIPPAEFEQLLAQLPLDDMRIADYLGASRQQVINLRRTARDRLLRCMKLLERE
jgi:RNA polymerase sigma factor (sigma-70 family)